MDALKIATEFVQDTDLDSRSSALAAAIVALSESLNIVTTAEGIETVEQADRMRTLGCKYAQGYFFARPQTEAALMESFKAEAASVSGAKVQPKPARPGRSRSRAGRISRPTPATDLSAA